jgi:glycosyltransferase involved in cell wall biosynthesis
MRVCVIAANNGAGLSRDLELISQTLAAAGYEVSIRALGRGKLRKWFRPLRVRAGNAWHALLGRRCAFGANLMLEHIRPEYLASADLNFLIPNPEYLTEADRALLPRIDRVFAKTRHSESIFNDLGCVTEFIGFTSEDRSQPEVARQHAFLHVPGRSGAKGTQAILEAWRAHPEWPPLTVVQSAHLARPGRPAANITHIMKYLDDDQLKRLQNAHRFHLCPSETEGFGHYLVEALSTGAVTLATDGEPMNELVTAQHGLLIPVARTGRQGAARTWLVQTHEIEAAVLRALSLAETECDAIGAAARRFYSENDRSFRARLVSVLQAVCEQPAETSELGLDGVPLQTHEA